MGTFYTSNGLAVMLADDICRTRHTDCRDVPVSSVVASQPLVPGDLNVLENREREAWHPIHVESRTRGGADRIIVQHVDVREIFVLISWGSVDVHRCNLGQRVVTRSTAPMPFG